MSTREAIMELAFDGVEADDIAAIVGCTVDYVLDTISGYTDTEYDDTMDGDFDSAMASAGFGTDEDYGYADSYDY